MGSFVQDALLKAGYTGVPMGQRLNALEGSVPHWLDVELHRLTFDIAYSAMAIAADRMMLDSVPARTPTR